MRLQSWRAYLSKTAQPYIIKMFKALLNPVSDCAESTKKIENLTRFEESIVNCLFRKKKETFRLNLS